MGVPSEWITLPCCAANPVTTSLCVTSYGSVESQYSSTSNRERLEARFTSSLDTSLCLITDTVPAYQPQTPTDLLDRVETGATDPTLGRVETGTTDLTPGRVETTGMADPTLDRAKTPCQADTALCPREEQQLPTSCPQGLLRSAESFWRDSGGRTRRSNSWMVGPACCIQQAGPPASRDISDHFSTLHSSTLRLPLALADRLPAAHHLPKL